MNTAQIIEIVFNLITIIFGIIILRYILKIRKQNKNPIDTAVFFLMLALFSIRLFDILSNILFIFSINIGDILRINYLGLNDILYMIYGVIFGWFILYIYGYRNSYSLPFVAGFFLELYIEFTDNRIPHNYFITYISLISSLILLRNAIKNKNGTSFSIFLATMVGIPEFYLNISWLSMIMPIIVYTAIYLGVSGWMDEKIFYDRKNKYLIQNTWISKTVRN